MRFLLGFSIMNNSSTLINYLALNKTNAKFSTKSNKGGILFHFSGRLKGSQRAKKLQLSYGKINTQTFNSTIYFSQKQIFTK